MMQTPVSQYRPVIRHFPRELAEIDYDERYLVRRVRNNSTIRWKAERYLSPKCSGVSALGFFRHRMERSGSTSERCAWESSKAKRQHSTQTDSACRKRRRITAVSAVTHHPEGLGNTSRLVNPSGPHTSNFLERRLWPISP